MLPYCEVLLGVIRMLRFWESGHPSSCSCNPDGGSRSSKEVTDIGAFIIRTGFGGILYKKYNKEPPKSIGNYLGSYSSDW